MNEFENAATIIVIGSNTSSGHPVISLGILRAVQKGASLIVINPVEIGLVKHAAMWLRQNPGTDVALLMGIARHIVDAGLADLEFVQGCCENFEAFKESLQPFDLDSVSRITGIDKEQIMRASELYAGNKPSSIIYAMGITQHSHGTDNVMAVANLSMLTGNIGKPSTGVNPLRGQNNVQGACDMGGLPNVYTAYQRVDNPEVRAKFEKAWVTQLNPKPGLTLMEIMDAAHNGEIRAVYLMGENPVISEPDMRHTKESLQKLDFLVVQDMFLSETAELAHVVLPAASFAEKDGTFTNTERRVQRVRKVIEPLHGSHPDWQILGLVAKKMGAPGFDFNDASAIMEELAILTPSYGGISYSRIEKCGLQWPCPTPDHPGTPILHMSRFTCGLGKFIPLKYRPPAELPDADYPFTLITGRSLFHFHTGTMTRKVNGLNAIEPRCVVTINPQDAAAIGVRDGDSVELSSRRGKITAASRLHRKVAPQVVYMDFHYAESAANVLTNTALDPIAKIPELKICAVRVEGAGKNASG